MKNNANSRGWNKEPIFKPCPLTNKSIDIIISVVMRNMSDDAHCSQKGKHNIETSFGGENRETEVRHDPGPSMSPPRVASSVPAWISTPIPPPSPDSETCSGVEEPAGGVLWGPVTWRRQCVTSHSIDGTTRTPKTEHLTTRQPAPITQISSYLSA